MKNLRTQEKLKKIFKLAFVGENICRKHKCGDVKLFFRVIKELAKNEVIDTGNIPDDQSIDKKTHTVKENLYNRYLHEVLKPLSLLRRVCLSCENYHLCGLNKKIDALIDKSHEIITEALWEEENEINLY